MKRFLLYLKTRGIRKTFHLSLSHLERSLPIGTRKLFRKRSNVTNDDILMCLCILQKEIRDLKNKLDRLEERK